MEESALEGQIIHPNVLHLGKCNAKMYVICKIIMGSSSCMNLNLIGDRMDGYPKIKIFVCLACDYMKTSPNLAMTC